MSEYQQGPDWWQASDGKWYPPQQPGVTPAATMYAPRPVSSNTAGWALGAAIGSFVVCPGVLGVVGLVLASKAAREEREAGVTTNEGIIKAARIVSIVNIVLFVVGFVGIVLLAIAIPTFLGAQERAQDRATQSELRLALTAIKTLETNRRPVTAPELQVIEPSLRFEDADGFVANDTIDVAVGDGIVGVASRSDSGTCFYAATGTDGDAFAQDDACGAIEEQDYFQSWN